MVQPLMWPSRMYGITSKGLNKQKISQVEADFIQKSTNDLIDGFFRTLYSITFKLKDVLTEYCHLIVYFCSRFSSKDVTTNITNGYLKITCF